MDIKEFATSFENRKMKLKPLLFIESIFIIVLMTILVSCNEFTVYHQGQAYVLGENTIATVIRMEDVDLLLSHKYMKIGGSTITYKVKKIEEELLPENGIFYQTVWLEADLQEEMNVPNYTFPYQIVIGKNTILEYVIKTMKGE